MQTSQKPAAQTALNELKTSAQTPEDHAQIEAWQSEVDNERAQIIGNLGKETAKLALMPDGTVATQSEVQTRLQSGQDASHPYEHGRRA